MTHLCATVRGSPVVTVDETSWRVDADLQWLWAYVTARDHRLRDPTGPRPRAGRAGDRARLSRRAAARRLAVVSLFPGGAASDLSGASAAPLSRPRCLDYPGPPVCRARSKPFCRPPSRRATPTAAATCRRTGSPSRAATTSSASAGCWNARPVAAAPVRRFQQHLIVEFDAIFSFLFDPTLDATNWRAEHALRPAVVTRKMCGGGNRTARGADTSADPHQRAAHRRSARPRRHRSARHAPHRAHARSCPRASAQSPRYTDPLNKDSHIPTHSQLPNPNEPGSWALEFGIWECVGMWNLELGI